MQSKMMTAHREGVRLELGRHGGRILGTLREARPGLPDRESAPVFDLPEGAEGSAQAGLLQLGLEALLAYWNLGGDMGRLASAYRDAGSFLEGAEPASSRWGAELQSVMRPVASVVSVWKDSEGRYVSVVSGDEGFVESFDTEAELLASYSLPDPDGGQVVDG